MLLRIPSRNAWRSCEKRVVRQDAGRLLPGLMWRPGYDGFSARVLGEVCLVLTRSGPIDVCDLLCASKTFLT